MSSPSSSISSSDLAVHVLAFTKDDVYNKCLDLAHRLPVHHLLQFNARKEIKGSKRHPKIAPEILPEDGIAAVLAKAPDACDTPNKRLAFALSTGGCVWLEQGVVFATEEEAQDYIVEQMCRNLVTGDKKLRRHLIVALAEGKPWLALGAFQAKHGDLAALAHYSMLVALSLFPPTLEGFIAAVWSWANLVYMASGNNAGISTVPGDKYYDLSDAAQHQLARAYVLCFLANSKRVGEKQRYKLDYGLKQLARGLSVFSGTKWFRHHPDRTPGRLRGPNDFLQWALKDDEEYCNITTADIIGLRHELSLLMEPGTKYRYSAKYRYRSDESLKKWRCKTCGCHFYRKNDKQCTLCVAAGFRKARRNRV